MVRRLTAVCLGASESFGWCEGRVIVILIDRLSGCSYKVLFLPLINKVSQTALTQHVAFPLSAQAQTGCTHHGGVHTEACPGMLVCACVCAQSFTHITTWRAMLSYVCMHVAGK